MKVAFCEWNPASVELNNQLLTTILFNFPFFFFQSYFLFMNTNVTSGFFSSKDVDFTLRFPGIIKKKNMQLEGEHFQWLHTWKRGFILFCTVKHLFQLHTWQFLLQVRVVLELRSTVASLTTSLLPDWITITAPSPQWGGLLFKHNYTERLSIPNHSLGIANSFFPLHRV